MAHKFSVWFKYLRLTKPVNNVTGTTNVKRYWRNILCVLKYVQYWLKNGRTFPFLAKLKIVNLSINQSRTMTAQLQLIRLWGRLFFQQYNFRLKPLRWGRMGRNFLAIWEFHRFWTAIWLYWRSLRYRFRFRRNIFDWYYRLLIG